MPNPQDFAVPTLGQCHFRSPLAASGRRFVDESVRVRHDHDVDPHAGGEAGATFERAGPREKLYFDPKTTTAAFVTCGGLSPGLNNVIRSGFLELIHNYGVRRVLGIRNGYAGLNPASGFEPVEIDGRFVDRIHQLGGTVLGSSRGPQEPSVVVDFLVERDIDILFCIGGDGTQRGAHTIHEEIARRRLPKAVVGIPKTIDNDVRYVWMSFGYNTALESAAEVLRGAHAEASSAHNGIGLVKLMGRHAGYIAAAAAVVSQDANFVLIPEVAVPLLGDNGFLAALERRILKRAHALVVVAEGAGQEFFEDRDHGRDASGNERLDDIGVFLRDRIKTHFAERQIPMTLKDIDPSYIIRSRPANAWDRILCDRMARNAVHAGMAGKAGVMIGYWNQRVIHVPIATAVAESKQLPVDSDLWNAVLATTGQPNW